MFDVLLVEASFSMCYYIHAELYFDMSLSKGPGFLSIGLYRAVINSVIKVSVAEKFLSWSSASALSVFDWHQFPSNSKEGMQALGGFWGAQWQLHYWQGPEGQALLWYTQNEWVTFNRGEKTHILHMFLGDTQP